MDENTPTPTNVDTTYDTTSNYEYNQASVLQLRLDTSSTVNRFEMFLRASKYEVYEDTVTGETKSRLVNFGSPKANELGVQSIMAYLTAIINTQTVQGNFTEGEYINYVIEARKEFAKMLMLNRKNWGVAVQDYPNICGFFSKIIWPYMSRPKDDGERKSFANSMRSEERNVVQQKQQGGFRIPFIGRIARSDGGM